ncbi:glycosyltransferase [Mucilaginibacter pedocola]|uniref:Glycosyl transferase family 2 n=1 Tax=Mucilaginibacter pedocola TaxID=1792845 RepID=A0A1S9P6X5_9SPHI|nr:glycosyltransferase [Mucilaginibacter pedocola]OOQ56706.1 hypothetical protein BC343_17060 [Mucilaginibacter pedocola]
MDIIAGLVFTISLLAFTALAMQCIYLLIFALAGHFKSNAAFPPASALGSFVIYIPAYKEDAVILDTAIAALSLDYPQSKRRVVVIADKLMPATLAALRSMPLQVVEVAFEQSTKAKALNYAIKQTEGVFDYALILDADNICSPDFLLRMNEAMQQGCQVVQGQRVAKNTNTKFAFLDAVSEGVNNHIFRQGHRALGLSCAIIGSGFAMQYQLFVSVMDEIKAVGGFDKEMELRLLRTGVQVAYATRALVYDEKAARQANFENQRRRWLSAQIHYMQRYIADGFIQLTKGNIDFFDKVVQTMLLPRALMLGVTSMLFILSLLPGYGLPAVYWLVLCAATFFAVFISIPSQYFNRQLLSAALGFPLAFFSMFKLLFKLKGANKTFIHTAHGDVSSAQ